MFELGVVEAAQGSCRFNSGGTVVLATAEGPMHDSERAASQAIRARIGGGGPVPAALEEAARRERERGVPDPAAAAAALRHADALSALLVDGGAGAALTDGLLRALTGDLPGYVLDEGRGSLLGVLWKLRLVCPPDHFTAWCRASLEVVAANFASQEITQDLLKSVAVEPPRKDNFYEALSAFARCFNQKAKSRRR